MTFLVVFLIDFFSYSGVAASTALPASPSSGRASFTSIDGDVFQRFSWCTMTANTNYGCGLVIVERICEHMSWPFELNDDGIRFTAKVDFYS